MKKITCIMVLVLSSLTSVSFADEFMSADQVKALMTNKTFDGIYLPKDKQFKVFEDADGTHNVYYPKKDKLVNNREWKVNEKGQHCTTHPKWDDYRCSHVKDAGNGEYHKINDDGEHTHTLTNFREGNKLESE